MNIQSGQSRRPFGKNIILWAAGIFSLVLLLLMRSPLVDRWAQHVLQSVVQERAHLFISFSHFRIGLVPLSLSFHDVTFMYDSPNAATPMMQAKEITVRASLLALLLNSQEKFYLVTQNLQVHADLPSDVPTLLKSFDSSSPTSFRISEIDKLIRRSPIAAIEFRNASLFFSTIFEEKTANA